MPSRTHRPWYPVLALGLLLYSPAAIAFTQPVADPTSLDSPHLARANAVRPYDISPHLPISSPFPPSTQEDLVRQPGLPIPTHPSTLPLPHSPTLLALVRYRRPAPRRPRWGAPRWSYGGAARGDGCREAVRSPLVPLVPLDGSADQAAFLGQTAAAFPTLLVYVPETTAQAVSLLVVNENRDSAQPGQVVYERTLPLPQSPGILRFDLNEAAVDLPPTVPLQPGQYYTWMVSLVCQPDDPSGNPFVQGLIQRVVPDGEIPPEQSRPIDAEDDAPGVPNPRTIPTDAEDDPLAQVNAYGAAGLWHETVAGLAELYCETSNDLALRADWRALLNELVLTNAPELVQQVQSQTIADAPLLWCGDPTP